jgi:PhzF family phenazine biosynthesis protein
MLKQWVVDAFADAPFEGNPAAVVPLAAWLDDGLMQRIAAENNLSETAFFVESEPGRYGLRWFTPASEVDLCGHATLASAHVVFSYVAPSLERVIFDTRSGPLTVVRGSGDDMTMDFPAIVGRVPDGADALARRLAAVMGSPVPLEIFTAPDLMVVFEDAADVLALSPQGGLSDLLNDVSMRGLIATAPSDDARYDFVSRFFAPNHGIPEDPVTGSAHCKLMPYWAKRLGRTRLVARQVSPRGGTVICELKGDRVTLTGRCELFLEGTLAVG